MKYAFEFLRILTSKIPPPPGCSHAIVLLENAHVSVAIVPEERQNYTATLDVEDFDKSPQQLADEIVAMYAEYLDTI